MHRAARQTFELQEALLEPIREPHQDKDAAMNPMVPREAWLASPKPQPNSKHALHGAFAGRLRAVILAASCCVAAERAAPPLVAADPPATPAPQAPATPPSTSDAPPKATEQAAIAERNRDLQTRLSGSVFEGQFTIDGQPDGPKQEMYELQSVTKLPAGDLWLFKTRIRYGGHDVTVPLPIPIKWADGTPVISVDQLNVPGLGVFDARVVISGDRYAGTWQHGEVGGHLFGRIVKKADAEKKGEASNGVRDNPANQ